MSLVVTQNNGNYSVEPVVKDLELNSSADTITKIKVADVNSDELMIAFYDKMYVRFIHLVEFISNTSQNFHPHEEFYVGYTEKIDYSIMDNSENDVAVVLSTDNGVSFFYNLDLWKASPDNVEPPTNTPSSSGIIIIHGGDSLSWTIIITLITTLPLVATVGGSAVVYILIQRKKKKQDDATTTATVDGTLVGTEPPIPLGEYRLSSSECD